MLRSEKNKFIPVSNHKKSSKSKAINILVIVNDEFRNEVINFLSFEISLLFNGPIQSIQYRTKGEKRKRF